MRNATLAVSRRTHRHPLSTDIVVVRPCQAVGETTSVGRRSRVHMMEVGRRLCRSGSSRNQAVARKGHSRPPLARKRPHAADLGLASVVAKVDDATTHPERAWGTHKKRRELALVEGSQGGVPQTSHMQKDMCTTPFGSSGAAFKIIHAMMFMTHRRLREGKTKLWVSKTASIHQHTERSTQPATIAVRTLVQKTSRAGLCCCERSRR